MQQRSVLSVPEARSSPLIASGQKIRKAVLRLFQILSNLARDLQRESQHYHSQAADKWVAYTIKCVPLGWVGRGRLPCVSASPSSMVNAGCRIVLCRRHAALIDAAHLGECGNLASGHQKLLRLICAATQTARSERPTIAAGFQSCLHVRTDDQHLHSRPRPLAACAGSML